MKNIGILLTTFCLIFSSCSYEQFGAAATGSTLGGVFGSSIGGLLGGYRGHEIGTAIGMTAGAAIGLAATSEKSDNKNYKENEPEYCHVEYDEYEPSYKSYSNKSNGLEALSIERIRFAEANNNRRLDAGEQASIEMEIYNYGDYPLYNIAPHITCDNKRVLISPSAIVEKLEAGQGFRYRAEVSASHKLKDGEAIFKISFGNGKNQITAKTFRILTCKE